MAMVASGISQGSVTQVQEPTGWQSAYILVNTESEVHKQRREACRQGTL